MPSLQPFQSDYPSDLYSIRAGVLATLGTNSPEGQKLSSCRFHSGCSSSFCPSCTRKAGILRKQQMLQAAASIPESRLKFGTFTSQDVHVDNLRETSKLLMSAGRSTLKALKVDGYALQLQVSHDGGSHDYHPHLHILLDTPTGGRNHVARDAWEDAWLAHLSADLHTSSSAIVGPVRSIAASCQYITRSPYADCAPVPDGAAIQRIVDSIFVTKGVQKFNLRGPFKHAA